MEQRHIDVFWLRQQGATTFGLYVMAMHAAWEPGRYAWIAAGGQMARHAFHQLAKMLPDAGVTRTNRTLRLAHLNVAKQGLRDHNDKVAAFLRADLLEAVDTLNSLGAPMRKGKKP